MELTSKKRAYLRKISHNIDPIVRIGKDGLTDNIVSSLVDALEARELVKVKVLNNSEEEAKEIGGILAEKTDSILIHVMGSTMLYFKVSKNNPSISEELKGI